MAHEYNESQNIKQSLSTRAEKVLRTLTQILEYPDLTDDEAVEVRNQIEILERVKGELHDTGDMDPKDVEGTLKLIVEGEEFIKNQEAE